MTNVLVDLEAPPEALRRLRAIPEVKVRLVESEERARPLSSELIRDTHILFCTLPPANFSEMRSLELIQLTSAGYGQLYDLPLVERGVRACNGRGIFDTAIAEWNIAMMVNMIRDLRGMIRHQHAGIWDRSAIYQREIRGLVTGIWGYGGIGRETGRLAKAMGLTVHVMSRKGVGPSGPVYTVPGTGDPHGTLPDHVYSSGQEMEFLETLDFLVLSVPLCKTTAGIIGEKELQSLPRSAFVLNPARGPLIQEDALLTALRRGWIAGAALDAHYYYPMPADHPLWRFPNVIMTPHISGSDKSPHFIERAWDIFMQNVRRFITGQPLLNELTPSQLAGC